MLSVLSDTPTIFEVRVIAKRLEIVKAGLQYPLSFYAVSVQNAVELQQSLQILSPL
jgi:hypothetical protein